MDNSTYDFFNEVKNFSGAEDKEKNRDCSTKNSAERGNSLGDFGFDYESVVADSSPSNSIRSSQKSGMDSRNFDSQLNGSEQSINLDRHDRYETISEKTSISSGDRSSGQPIHPNNNIVLSNSLSGLAEKKRNRTSTPYPGEAVGTSQTKYVRDVDQLFKNVRFQNITSRLSDYEPNFESESESCGSPTSSLYDGSSTYTDDVDNLEVKLSSLTTTTGDSQSMIIKNQVINDTTNRSGVKHDDYSECGRKPIDKWMSGSKIGGNASKPAPRNFTYHLSHKKIGDQDERDAQNRKLSKKNQRFRTTVPIQLKSEAFYQNGELQVTLTSDCNRNPIGDNVDLKITIIHKHSTHTRNEKKGPLKRSVGYKNKSHNGKTVKSKIDRNVIENRANWSEFNTALTEEANKRYRNRHGFD